MENFYEKTIRSETIFRGKVIRVDVDEVQLPNGKTAKRELVKHSGAVAVMAITDDEELVLVRQFRKPLERTILEIPAGKLESGEHPDECAKRELAEETGYTADEWRPVASFFTSPGFADEIIHIYEARGLRGGKAEPDEDEFVEKCYVRLPEAFEKIASGEICDAKTIFAVYAWQNEKLKKE